MEWSVIPYSTEDGKEPVFEFIQTLPEKHQAKAIWEIDLLEKFGINLTEPYVKPIEGDKYKGLWELRIQQGNNISRIFYFLSIENTFVLLHGFLKKSQKTSKRELNLALEYMLDYKRRCKNERT